MLRERATQLQGMLDGAAERGEHPPTIDQLLDLASVAAHTSERLAAPLSCWLVAIAGASPEDALATARSLADDLTRG